MFGRRVLVTAALLMILGSLMLGRLAFAQDQTPEPVTQPQPGETDDGTDFPWGLLGLLGLGGLARAEAA